MTVLRTFVVLFGLVVAVVVAGWFLQRRLIYFPGGDPGRPPAGWEEVTISTADDLDLSAWLAKPSPEGDRDVVVVVFPGNAGNRLDRTALGDRLAGAGLTVLLVDYRGYGGNPGTPSEPGLREDARAALAFVDDAGLGANGVVYLGESLGSGVAVGLAVETPPDALVLKSPFTSLADVAGHHYGGLPVGWLLRDRYPSLDRASTVAGTPTLVIAGTADRTVPFEQSRRLASAIGAEFHIVDGADHNDPQLSTDPELVQVIAEFLTRASD